MRALARLILYSFVGTLARAAPKNVAYIHGDVAPDGAIPSGSAAAYDQMLLSDSGATGCSQFKSMVEAQGYTISQHYDQTTTLHAAFLNSFDVVLFGLHQKVWSGAEKAALDTWIRAGGGILMYSDSAAGGYHRTVGIKNSTGQTAVNNVLSAYGMQVAVDQGGGVRAYAPSANATNPILWNQPVFEGEGVSPVAVDPNGAATALIPFSDANKVSGSSISIDARGVTIVNPQWAVIGHASVGDGNVIALFDRQPMWNNGPGSDINEEDNKEVLRRIVRYLARDYGNSSEWLALTSTNGLELTYRQWSGGTGELGYDYTARDTRFAVEQTTNLTAGAWSARSNGVESVSIEPETAETEFATVRLLPIDGSHVAFARVAAISGSEAPLSDTRAINCGGPAYLSDGGIHYEADNAYTGGHIDAFPGNAVAGTTDDALYNTARSGHASYDIPLPNGTYSARLQFAETYFTAANKRKFDVAIEGAQVITELDLFAAAGKWVAHERVFSATVSDGVLNITFTASINNPLINAIVVTPN